MSSKRVSVFIALAIALILLFILMGIGPAYGSDQTKNTGERKPFDHSNCQYPNRWTNPVDGCDNSDPAVPECIKAFDTEQGEADCIAEQTKQLTPAAELEAANFEGK